MSLLWEIICCFIASYVVAAVVVFIMKQMDSSNEKLLVLPCTIGIFLVMMFFMYFDVKNEKKIDKTLHNIYNATTIEEVQEEVDEYYAEHDYE